MRLTGKEWDKSSMRSNPMSKEEAADLMVRIGEMRNSWEDYAREFEEAERKWERARRSPPPAPKRWPEPSPYVSPYAGSRGVMPLIPLDPEREEREKIQRVMDLVLEYITILGEVEMEKLERLIRRFHGYSAQDVEKALGKLGYGN